MSGGGEAVITLGAFFGTLLLLVWLRVIVLGRNSAGWVTASNIQLNMRWGRPNSQGLRRMKSKARADVLKSLGGSADPLVIELNEKLEILGDKAERVVPPISTTGLAIMVVFEALQYIAIPFASGVAWNRDSKWGFLPKILAYGVPHHNISESLHALVWLVSLPTIIAVLFTGMLVLLIFLVTLAWYCGGLFAHGYGRLSGIATALVRFYIWLLTITKELIFDFGVLYILTGLLMITSCTLHGEHFTDVECWKVPSQAVLNPLSVLQIILYIVLLFWSDLPVHGIPSWIERMLATKLGIRMSNIHEENDHMLLRRELGSKDLQLDVLVTTGGVQVFDFHRPMFSSWSSGVHGSVKIVLSFLYVFAGDRADWQWTMLSITAVCYCILLLHNTCGSPCTFHWINVSRSMGLLVGIGAVGCALLVEGLGTTSDIPTMLFSAILLSYLFFGPFVLYWAYRSHHPEGEMGGLMGMDIMQSYQRLVILCQTSQLVRQEISLEKESRIQTDESLLSVFYDVRNSMIRDISRRLILRRGEWSSWSKQGNCLYRNIFCCCSWCMDHGNREEFSDSHEVPPHPPPASFTARGLRSNMKLTGKVERWMATACLIIDPSEDVELGLNVPLDMYFSAVDGVPKYTGNETLSGQGLAHGLLDSGSNSSAAPGCVKMEKPVNDVSDALKQGLNAQDGPCNAVKEVHVTPYENP